MLFAQVMDQLTTEMENRFHQLDHFSRTFGFLSTESLLGDAEHEAIKKNAEAFISLYDEVDLDCLLLEIKQLRRLAHGRDEVQSFHSLDLLRWIIKWQLEDSMPSLLICLRIYLTVGVSVASCERSFSKLKLIKSYLRSTMGQNRLSNLAILSIDRNKAENIDFENIIKSFASVKARKVHFK